MELQKLRSLSLLDRTKIVYRKGLKLDETIANVTVPLYEEVLHAPLKTLKKYSTQWDGFSAEPIVLEKTELKKSFEDLQKEQRPLLESFGKAADNIRDFHRRQKPTGFEAEIAGNRLGYRFQPFDSVALYVPGGKALYPSTVLMGVIPAVIAGVESITILTPPNPTDKGVPQIVRAMAYLAGADRILQAGGGQAVLAAAVGIPECSIAPVDFIYGPGNLYVSAAKAFVASKNLCGIDTFAGPSEVVIIADSSSNPIYLAHDLLAQAEHDEDAISILLCLDEEIAQQTIDEIGKTIEERNSDRKEITSKAIEKNGRFFLVDNYEEAILFTNEFAPEHLEIQTQNSEEILGQIKAAGSVFVGGYSPVAVGDYYSGTNHILPTNRAARFSSGVSVHSFYRRITYQKCSEEGLKLSKEHITRMSKAEGLFDEHGYSVLIRFPDQ